MIRSHWVAGASKRRVHNINSVASASSNAPTLRVNGTARIEPAEFAKPAYAEAQFVVVVDVREVFPNCPRYIHKFQRVERSKFVPHEGVPTPVPGWKKMDWACDVLARNDPARRES